MIQLEDYIPDEQICWDQKIPAISNFTIFDHVIAALGSMLVTQIHELVGS